MSVTRPAAARRMVNALSDADRWQVLTRIAQQEAGARLIAEAIARIRVTQDIRVLDWRVNGIEYPAPEDTAGES